MKYFCVECSSYSCGHQKELQEKASEALKNKKEKFKHEEE
tara:strand:- start:1760 stop:1879 length:120 start_codon:yes stop_codon:yes gene_type:complete